jgi:acyl-CoA synthetase (AMP-forming)/AMP-acid ligase II
MAPMFAPELYNPPLDLPEIPYDHLLRMAAERRPDHTAMIFHDVKWSYRQLVSMVNSIANGMHDLGLGKGDRICLFTPNRPEYTIMLNAASTIGAVVTPMNPAYKEREITYQLGDSEASAIMVYQELLPLLQLTLSHTTFPHLKHIIVTGIRADEEIPGTISFTKLLRETSPKRPDLVEIDPYELFAMPYSSGTTGLPKGTMLSHYNLTSNHLQVLAASGINEVDTTIIFLPMYHIYGVLLTGTFLAAGATQIIMERFDLLLVLETCEKRGVTWFFAVPPVILALANLTGGIEKLKSVKYLMNAAAPLPLAAARKLHERTGIMIVQGYGLTESSPDTHMSPPDPLLMRLESVGLLAPNTEQKIVDIETGTRELPVGEDGEIIVRGPQVMLGYWNAPEETKRVLRDGWLYTGDIGHVDAEGFTYIVDRKKEMIKYKGFSIAPAEIEGLLLEHDAVLDAAVIGVPDDEAGEAPKGFVVLRPDLQVTEEEIILFVNSRLAGYKKLHYVEFIDAIPKVPSGKILRRELKERERMKGRA